MKLGSKLLVAVLVVACMAIALTACGGGGGGDSGGGSAQVKPTIGTQPANQSVVTGSSATFAVIAAGGGTLVYQWKKNGTDISGASSSIYTTPATNSADNDAVFTVLVSNSAGTSTSNAARLAVTNFAVAPAISQQPENQSVVTGTSASFSVSATGTSPLSYQWKKNGADIPGATASTYTTPAASTEDSGAVYSVVVSNSVDKATSSDARLTVAAAAVAPSITSQPLAQTVNAGQVASFSVKASGTSPSYQWKKNGEDISGALSSSYTIVAASMEDNAAVFSVVVSNSAGHVTSNEARLAVSPTPPTPPAPPAISTQPASQSVPLGVTATFSVAASGTGTLHYQWKKFGAPIDGATDSPSYTTPVTTIFDNGAQYSVVVTDGAGNTVSSSNATLVLSKYSLVVKPRGGTYEITECVKDNGTGLVWEGKTASPGSTSRLGTSTYTNFDNKNAAQHFAGTGYPTQDEIDASTNSIGYITTVNAGSGLCGYTDWRLPTKEELQGIRDAGQTSAPQIDKTWFPNTQDGSYWTSSPAGNGNDPSSATVIYFTSAFISGGGSRSSSLVHHVRLVRGNP